MVADMEKMNGVVGAGGGMDWIHLEGAGLAGWRREEVENGRSADRETSSKGRWARRRPEKKRMAGDG